MVKIVTDSVSDLPDWIVEDLDITVIPIILRFGSEEFRDNVDLTLDQFYEKLKDSPDFPETSVPPPTVFSDAYDRLAEDTDEILCVMLTSRLSGTFNVAAQARKMMKRDCRVEVIDTTLATMAEGFVVMKAAEAAKAGASLDETLEVARKNIPRSEIFCTFDTLEYLKRGGRIGAAQALMGSILKINPLIALKDGVVSAAGRTRSRSKAVQKLYDFVAGYRNIEELAVENTVCPEEADELVDRLSDLYPRERIYQSKMTPVIGAHTGPGLLLVAVLGDR